MAIDLKKESFDFLPLLTSVMTLFLLDSLQRMSCHYQVKKKSIWGQKFDLGIGTMCKSPYSSILPHR